MTHNNIAKKVLKLEIMSHKLWLSNLNIKMIRITKNTIEKSNCIAHLNYLNKSSLQVNTGQTVWIAL